MQSDELDDITFEITKVWVLQGRDDRGKPYLVRRPSTRTIATFDLRAEAVEYSNGCLNAEPVLMHQKFDVPLWKTEAGKS